MTLGALLDAGLPLDELKRALGSLALEGVDVTATRVLRTGVSATQFIVHEQGSTGNPPSSLVARLSTLEHAPSTLEHPPSTHLSPTFVGNLQTRGQIGPISWSGGRGRHSSDAGRAGPPARGRRPRLDHRHRRHRVRPGVGRRGPDRVLAAERRRRHRALGARRVSGARAGDGEAARRRADLQRRGAEGTGDADRRADRDDLRVVVRTDSGDVGRARRLRRRRSRRSGDAERPARADRPRNRNWGGRARRRHRVRDRRHEPADLRRGDGSALRGGRARGVLRAGADEEESARARC